MVQDIYDPEFYLGFYKVKDLETSTESMKCGMYKDIADCLVRSSRHNLFQDWWNDPSTISVKFSGQ